MSFAEDLSRDFTDVFANIDEFGVEANIGGHSVRALRVEVLETEGFGIPEHNTLVLDVAQSDVPDIARGTDVVVDGERFVVSSFETRDGVVRLVGGRR